MIDWLESAAGLSKINIEDITDQIPNPHSEDSQTKWFYTTQGRMVRIGIDNGRVVVLITENRQTIEYVINVSLGGRRFNVSWELFSPVGWSEQNLKFKLADVAIADDVSKKFNARIVSTQSSSGGGVPLTGLIMVAKDDYLGLIELVWDGRLRIKHVHTQSIDNTTRYYLASNGYYRISHHSDHIMILKPSGKSVRYDVSVSDTAYGNYVVNQYGLLHQEDFFYISWYGQSEVVKLNSDSIYVLNGRYLMSQDSGSINIVDITNNMMRTVEGDEIPVDYDDEYQIVITKATDGIVIHRLEPTMPVYHISPLLRPEIESGNREIIKRRLDMTVNQVQGSFQLISMGIRLFPMNIIMMGPTDMLQRDRYQYQYIPELKMLAVRFLQLSNDNFRAYRFSIE